MQYDNHVNVLKHTIHSIDRQYITVIPKKKKKGKGIYQIFDSNWIKRGERNWTGEWYKGKFILIDISVLLREKGKEIQKQT